MKLHTLFIDAYHGERQMHTFKYRLTTSIVLLVGLFAGCSPDQYLLTVDTDAPVSEQVTSPTSGARLSAAAVIDTIRVDLMDEAGKLVDTCEFGQLTAAVLPLSLGLARDGVAKYIRVRGFRKVFSKLTQVTDVTRLCGREVTDPSAFMLSEPLPAVTIDRLVRLPEGAKSGLQDLRLSLPLSCIGAQASVLTQTSCLGGDSLPAQSARLDDPRQWQTQSNQDSPHTTSAGSSPFAVERPCTLPPPAQGDQPVCVPGGFSIMGDVTSTLDNPDLASAPLRAVVVPPFYLDRREVSTARFQGLRARAAARGTALGEPFTGSSYPTSSLAIEYYNCTWRSKLRDAANLPANCLLYADAKVACEVGGGRLPTEAEWEHAARGRGQGYQFPWGAQRPDRSDTCCKSAFGRLPHGATAEPPPRPEHECGELGPAPIGDYQGEACPEGGDVSIDGVLDLGGNVSEYVLDDFRPYSERCGLDYGLTRGPLCSTGTTSQSIIRGSSWLTYAAEFAKSARRKLAQATPSASGKGGLPTADVGFRCAYAGE